jgi:hypothetical protein
MAILNQGKSSGYTSNRLRLGLLVGACVSIIAMAVAIAPARPAFANPRQAPSQLENDNS